MQLLYGNISALGDLLIPIPHQSIPKKLAIELQWTAYYACLFVFGSLLATRLQEIRILFARARSWVALWFWAAVCLYFKGTRRIGMQYRSLWWPLDQF